MPTKTKSKKPAAVSVTIDKTKKRKHGAPSNAFMPGNTMGFRPGESGNVGGKPHHMDALLSRSLRIALADRAPDEVCKALGLQAHASWAQCLSRKLIYMAVRGDLQALVEIRNCTEGTRSRIDVFAGDGEERSVIELIWVESDGAGRPVPGLDAGPGYTAPPLALPPAGTN